MSLGAIRSRLAVLALAVAFVAPPLAARAATYSVNVRVLASSGAVMAGPIDCYDNSGTCAAQFTAPVTLTAVPDSGFAVKSWSGCTPSADLSTCTVPGTASTVVLVYFKSAPPPPPTSYTLEARILSASGTVTGGGISCTDNTGTCAYPEAVGAAVTLSAVPTQGFATKSWSGCTPSADLSTCALAMNANTAVYASFVANQTCAVPNGTGAQTWDAATNGWGPCTAAACDSGYSLVNGACIASTAGFSTALLPVSLPGSPPYGYGNYAWDGDGNLLAVAGDTRLHRVDRRTDAVTSFDLPLPAGTQLVAVAYNPADGLVYVASEPTIWAYSPSLGTIRQVTTQRLSVNTMAFAPSNFGAYAGQLVGAGSFGVVAVDVATGAISTVANTGLASSIAFGANGLAYVARDGQAGVAAGVYSVSAQGVIATVATGIGKNDGIATDDARQRLYVSDYASSSIWSVPMQGGAATKLPGTFPFNGGYWPTPMAYDGSGTLLTTGPFAAGSAQVIAVGVP